MIKVSVIIPVFNASLLINRCLDSVFNQKTNDIIEVIVIDDGSSDNSLELLNSYSRPLTILKQINQGAAAARNKGIKIATGEYLAFLDADDYWELNFLLETLSFLENNDTIAVSVGQIHKITGKKDRVMPQLIIENHDIDKRGIVLDDFYKFWANHNHICTGSVLMRTEVVKKTGGQREELRITEDLEFWAYLATFGKWGFIPKVLLTTDGGLSVKKNGYLRKNRKRWNNAPSIKNWERRIILNLNDKFDKSFSLAKGRMAKMLMYSYLQSFRLKLAHLTVKEHISNFPQGKDTNIYKLVYKFGYFSWVIISFLLIIREVIKSFRYLNVLK